MNLCQSTLCFSVINSCKSVHMTSKTLSSNLGPLATFCELFRGLLVSRKLKSLKVEVNKREESGAILILDVRCLKTSQHPFLSSVPSTEYKGCWCLGARELLGTELCSRQVSGYSLDAGSIFHLKIQHLFELLFYQKP